MQDETLRTSKIHLIESDESEPRVKLTLGKRYEVVVTPIVDADLRQITEEVDDAQARRPSRLCGSRSTCVALVEIETN